MSSVLIPVAPDTAVKDLQGVIEILTKWVGRLSGEIPGIDFQCEPKEYEFFLLQLIGELRVASGRIDNLADTYAGQR